MMPCRESPSLHLTEADRESPSISLTAAGSLLLVHLLQWHYCIQMQLFLIFFLLCPLRHISVLLRNVLRLLRLLLPFLVSCLDNAMHVNMCGCVWWRDIFMYVCTYVFMYGCMYASMHACMHVYASMHACMHACKNTHTHTDKHTHTHTHTETRAHANARTHTHTNQNTHKDKHTHFRTQTPSLLVGIGLASHHGLLYGYMYVCRHARMYVGARVC